jgi:hypothetical protein
MIHIHGGSVLLETIARAGIPGDRLEWSDVLCQGPTPGGLTNDAWYDVRARFLTSAYGPGEHDVRRSLAAQDAGLERARAHDEIVLWFGPELFCQAIFVRLLDHFAARPPTKTRLALVSVDRYPGVDDRRACTLGALSGDQLRALYERRPGVTSQQLALGQRAWRAMTAPTPESLVALLREDTSALPYLGAALRRLLAELPDATGLSRTERLILDALAAGPRTGFDLFVLANEPEPRRWITDTILLANLRRLADGPTPLVELQGNGKPLGQTARRTDAATAVLAGRDAVEMRGVDRWVGGTHLTTHNVWRWDDARATLTRD